MNKKNLAYLTLALLVAVASEVHFYPLNSDFRISLGIIIINIIGLIRDDVEPLPLILLSGAIIFIERIGTSMLFLHNSYEMAFLTGAPSLVYYIVFAMFFSACHIYQNRDGFFRTIFALVVIDGFSNCLEAFLRGDLGYRSVMVIVTVGLIRSFIAYAVFTVWRRKEIFIIRQEHQKRYTQLNMLVANVEAELFYLKKSANDIESVMSKCYNLYASAEEDSAEKNQLLDISKDIHEIKKDYQRVLSGFQDFVDTVQDMEYLTVREIFAIMGTNYDKIHKGTDQEVEIVYEQVGNPKIKSYLSIFTILNNLIDNSIAACPKGGVIHVAYREMPNQHCFTVIDNGSGMSGAVQALIFNPGFTTKYDEITGKASTGIGLTHVKNTVENLGGQITVESIEGSGTKFTLTIKRLPGGES